MNWTDEERSDAQEIFVLFANADMQMHGDEISLLFFLQKVHWSFGRTRSILRAEWHSFNNDLENLLAQVEREPESPRDEPPKGGSLAKAGLHPWNITPLSVMKRKLWGRTEILQFREAFNACDSDESCSLSHHEIMAALSVLRLYPERLNIAVLIAETDVDGSGELNFWEFVTLLALLTMPETKRSQEKNASMRKSELAPEVSESERANYLITEAETRSLLVALQGFRMDIESADAMEEDVTADDVAEPSRSAAESLLACINKIRSSNMKTRIQIQLQNFILEFLLMAPDAKADPVNMAKADPRERWQWWCQYHCWDHRRNQFENRDSCSLAGTSSQSIGAQCPDRLSQALTRVTTVPALPTSFNDSDENQRNNEKSHPGMATQAKCDVLKDRSSSKTSAHDVETQAIYDAQQKIITRARHRVGKIHNILPITSQKPRQGQTEREDIISWNSALACEQRREAENKRKTNQLLFAPFGGCPRNLGFRGFRSRRQASTLTHDKTPKPTPKHSLPWFANDPQFHRQWTAHNALDPKTRQRFPSLSSSNSHKNTHRELTHGSGLHSPHEADSVDQSGKDYASHQLWTKIDIEENAYGIGSKTAAPHFKRVTELRTMPHYAPAQAQYAYYQMRDADFEAATRISVPSDTIDLSYNRITRLDPLLHIPWINECRVLKLVGLKLAGESPFVQMSAKCPRLHTISLAQTPLPQHWIHELTLALKAEWYRSLSVFNVAGTGLGRNGQYDCVKLFETLRLCNSLCELDISDNVLKEAGFRVIKELIDEKSRVRHLFMSDNGGPPGIDTGMSIVFEGISRNSSLQVLDISNSNLRFSDAFVLETMMMTHRGTLENILMTNNPLGSQGMVCVLRMVTEGRVSMVDVAKFRDCEYQEISFRTENPSGLYDLDLAFVLDRVQLIRLMLWADKWEMSHKDVFRDIKYDGRACELSAVVRRGKLDRYDVHVEHGRVQFMFTGHIPLRGSTNNEVLRNWHESRRQKMTMASFAVLANLYIGLTTEQEMGVLLRAASSALLLKISHLKFLIDHSPIFLRADVVVTAYPALDCMDRLTGIDVLSRVMTVDKNSYTSVRAAEECDHKTRSANQFNPANPTGRYELDLTVPPDYALLERVLIINMFEKQIAAKLGRTDCSRYGNGDAIRNFVIDTGSLQEVTEDFAVWDVPPFGVGSFVRFDYVSPLRPRASLEITKGTTVTSILNVMESASLPEIDKVNCLRSISDALVWNVPIVRKLLQTLSGPPTRSWTHKARGFNTVEKLSMLPAVSRSVGDEIADTVAEPNPSPAPQERETKAGATTVPVAKTRQDAIFESETDAHREACVAKVARIEAVILLFNRVADRIGMCCPGGCVIDNCLCDTDDRFQGLLYSCQVFNRKDIKELVMRLGILNCFDALHCCQRVPSNVGCEWKKQLLRSRVVCNLAVYEDRRLCAFLIRLALKEDGESMKDVSYSATRVGAKKLGASFAIPSAWVTDLPTFGIVQITYVSDKKECCLIDKRHELALQYFSWKDF